MLIVYKSYDDNTAEIIDLCDYSVKFCRESVLLALAKTHNVIGLSVSNNKINYITSYNIMTFPTENEATEYIESNGLSYRNRLDLNGMYYVLEKTNEIIHVNYIVGYITEAERLYLAKKGYTPYIQAAKIFDKKDAFKVANVMTHNSKTGKRWSALRIPVK
ncbi:MAG: hypothetical protein J6A59_16005 [Lachnospiraceae bacterium]|nr:hypothetical protein [Lachnospiraceae bacterium]